METGSLRLLFSEAGDKLRRIAQKLDSLQDLEPGQDFQSYLAELRSTQLELNRVLALYGDFGLDSPELPQPEAFLPSENPNPVMRIHADTRILYANPPGKELLAAWGSQVGHPAPDFIKKIIKEAIQSGRGQDYDIPWNERVFSFSVVPVPGKPYANLYGSDISNRVQIEKELRESKDRLEGVLSSITEAYFVLNRNWQIVDYNQVAEREYMRKPKKDLIGRVFWEEFPQSIGNEYWRQYHQAFETGQPVHFEAISGVVPRWYEVHAYPREDLVEIYLHNIDDRKKAEDRLAYQARLMENVNDAIIACDADYRITAWNRAAEEMYGWTAGEAIGSLLLERVPADTPLSEREQFWGQLTRDGHNRGEFIHRNRAGQVFYVESNGMAFKDAGGRVTGYTTVNRDITSRRLAEEIQQRLEAENIHQKDIALQAAAQARQREAELAAVFNSMAEAVFIMDPSGKIIRRNQKTIELFGYDPIDTTRADVARRLDIRNASGEILSAEELPSSRALSSQAINNQILRIKNTRGEEMGISASAAPLYYEQQIAGAVVALHDNTERERLIDQLETVNLRLRDLLGSIVEGYLVLDAVWQIVDFNQVALTEFFPGKTPADLLGKVIWEEYPMMVGNDFYQHWLTAVEHNQPEHYEGYSTRLNKWFEMHVYPREEQLEVYMRDISERRHSEENNRFLAQLGEKLISLDDPNEMLQSSVNMIGAYLKVDHCTLDEVDFTNGQIYIQSDYHSDAHQSVWRYPFTALHRDWASGLSRDQVWKVFDAATDGSTAAFYRESLEPHSIQAFVSIPRIREEKWVGTLTVISSQPRAWREDEIVLLKQANDLVWLAVENSRLFKELRESQDRLHIALKNSQITVYTTDRERRVTWIYNPRHGYTEEDVIGKKDIEIPFIHGLEEVMKDMQSVLDSGVGVRREYRLVIRTKPVIFDITIEPTRDPDGEITGLMVATMEITAQRRLEEEMSEATAQVEIQREIIRHREEERMGIARDLHDGPLQELIGIGFSLNEARAINDKEIRVARIADLQQSIQTLTHQIRAFCSDLRPPTLMYFGLVKAIRSHTDSFREKHPDIRIYLVLMDDERELNEPVRMALYRIYQELLNNIVRHAGASEVYVQFTLDESQIELAVQDNGQGFQIPSRWNDLARSGHLGLVGIRERAQAVGGRVWIDSSPGKGARIRVIIPRGTSVVFEANELDTSD